VFALAILMVGNVNAGITSVEVVGIRDSQGINDISVFAGQTVPVRVFFVADKIVNPESVIDGINVAKDVRIRARISGEPSTEVTTERFDVLEGRTYSRLLSVQVPFDLDDNLDEPLRLVINVENRGGLDFTETVDLHVQRESYLVEIVDVQMNSKVQAGKNLILDIVLKNRGRQEAEDTFFVASIPALEVERRIWFGDLSPRDQNDPLPEKDDSAYGRLFLEVPRDAPAGVYSVELEAFNSDASTRLSRKVAVVGASEDSMVVSSVNSKTFSAGESEEFSLTLVNAGDKVRIYELILETSSGLTLSVEEPIVVVPAGDSRTVKILASAKEEGNFDFAVNVNSENELVQRESYRANVEGRSFGGTAGNATVLLTVILAIIFVVLLVVLIVLLTRKPEKTEEFGESYY
jgi:hypothetical protein